MYESAVAQSIPLQHTHPAERVGSLCHSECRNRRDCLDFRRVTSRRPLVNTAIPLFSPALYQRAQPTVVLIAPPRPTQSTDIEWRTPWSTMVRWRARARIYESRSRKVISNGTETFSLGAYVRASTNLGPVYGRPTIKTSGSCRKLLKWHSTLPVISGPDANSLFRRSFCDFRHRSWYHKVCNQPPILHTTSSFSVRASLKACPESRKRIFPSWRVTIALIAHWGCTTMRTLKRQNWIRYER